MVRTLTDIAVEDAALQQILDAADGEMDEELERWFDELGVAKTAKVNAYCWAITHAEANAAMFEAESKRIAAWSKKQGERAAWLKRRLAWYFESQGIDTMQTPHWKPHFVTNGGVQAIDWKVPVEKLPEEFIITKTTKQADTDAVRKLLDTGEELEFAELLPRGRSLRLK